MSELLLARLEYGVLHVTLNRPEKRNALSFELCRELLATFDRAENDPGVRAIVLAANGKSFCAGMDLSELTSVDDSALSHIHDSLFTLGNRLTKPLIAAVSGAALGGGTGLVANAHIVVASPRSTFGLTEVRLGLWPFLVFRSISLAIGERRALEWSITGRIVDAEEAHFCGLVHQVAEDAEGVAARIARELSGLSQQAIRGGLQYVQDARALSWDEAGETARRIRSQVMTSEEFAAGLKRFQENRAGKTGEGSTGA